MLEETNFSPFAPHYQRLEITGPFIVENEDGIVTIESNVTITPDRLGLNTAIAIKSLIDLIVVRIEAKVLHDSDSV